MCWLQTLRAAYAKKLDDEREAALKYKGENGIMKKKFTSLIKVRCGRWGVVRAVCPPHPRILPMPPVEEALLPW